MYTTILGFDYESGWMVFGCPHQLDPGIHRCGSAFDDQDAVGQFCRNDRGFIVGDFRARRMYQNRPRPSHSQSGNRPTGRPSIHAVIIPDQRNGRLAVAALTHALNLAADVSGNEAKNAMRPCRTALRRCAIPMAPAASITVIARARSDNELMVKCSFVRYNFSRPENDAACMTSPDRLKSSGR
jgi:hypothetical protein